MVNTTLKQVTDYEPKFFQDAQWRFLIAACETLVPSDEIGPGAVELDVPQFIDRHMRTSFAAGDAWYREAPFFDAGPEFGYQGGLSPREIVIAGMRGTDLVCQKEYAGRAFAELAMSDRREVLTRLENGEIGLTDLPAQVFFKTLLAEVMMGYFSNPSHGGNRDSGSWKLIGYPGDRGDYRDLITQQDTSTWADNDVPQTKRSSQ